MHRKLYTQATVHMADLLSPCHAAIFVMQVLCNLLHVATLTPLLYTRHSPLKNFSRIVKLIVSPLHACLAPPSYKTGGHIKPISVVYMPTVSDVATRLSYTYMHAVTT